MLIPSERIKYSSFSVLDRKHRSDSFPQPDAATGSLIVHIGAEDTEINWRETRQSLATAARIADARTCYYDPVLVSVSTNFSFTPST